MRNSNILMLVAAVIMGLVAAWLARGYLQGQSQASGGTIVVAAKSLSFGTKLTRDNTSEISWAAGSLPQGAFVSRTAMLKDGERVVLTPLARNEPVLSSKITGAGKRGSLSQLLDGDMRAVSVRVDDVRGVAGFILPGDHVDVVLIRKSYADVILQDIKVLAVNALVNERPDKANIKARQVTLALSPEQAQKVLLAVNLGKLTLTLRQPGQAPRQMRRITAQDLIVAEPIPVKESKPAQAPVMRNTTVLVIHGLKRKEYTVTRDGS